LYDFVISVGWDGLPVQIVQRAIARTLFGTMLQHDLRELLPLMEASGFRGVKFGSVNFRILRLSIPGFIRGSARKGWGICTIIADFGPADSNL
jgi:hypothetical protein